MISWLVKKKHMKAHIHSESQESDTYENYSDFF